LWFSVKFIKTRSQAVARIVDRTASQHLLDHMTSSVTWPFDTPYVISYWWSFGTESLSPVVFEILRSNRIGLTFQGHVMSSVMWPFDSPYAISYWWSFGTQSLNPVFFDILHSMRIGVTSLTVQGYVTSSVTWPFEWFDSLYAISYWWSFGTKPLSLTISEIFNVERNDWHNLDTTSKQRSRSFVLLPIDFSYMTSYRLSIVTFALAHTV